MSKKVLPRVTAFFMFCLALLALTGCDSTATDSLPADESKSTATYSLPTQDDILALMSYHDTYLGDSGVVKTLLKEHLLGAEFLKSFDITLNRLTISYELAEDSEVTPDDFAKYWSESNAKQIALFNATALMILIKNLEVVEFNIQGYTRPTVIINKDDLSQMYGEDLGSIDSAVKWQKLLQIGADKIDDFYQDSPFFQEN